MVVREEGGRIGPIGHEPRNWKDHLKNFNLKGLRGEGRRRRISRSSTSVTRGGGEKNKKNSKLSPLGRFKFKKERGGGWGKLMRIADWHRRRGGGWQEHKKGGERRNGLVFHSMGCGGGGKAQTEPWGGRGETMAAS